MSFENQQKVAMKLYHKSKPRNDKYALWVIHAILMLAKVTKGKDLKILDLANLL